MKKLLLVFRNQFCRLGKSEDGGIAAAIIAGLAAIGGAMISSNASESAGEKQAAAVKETNAATMLTYRQEQAENKRRAQFGETMAIQNYDLNKKGFAMSQRAEMRNSLNDMLGKTMGLQDRLAGIWGRGR